jgi:hypothetical protein
MIDKKQLIEELLECVKDATDTETQITGLSMCASLMNEVLDEALTIPDVVGSYVILYNNGDYEHFDGELAKAIDHLKEDRRYSNYGHNGAVLFKGKKVYSIADERTETFFT